MTIFSEGEGTGISDILISAWLVACCLISTCLNPLVFLYNYRRPNTVQRIVYRTLSSLDFYMCLIMPVVVVHNALAPVDCHGLSPQERGNSTILWCSRNATTLDKVISATTWPCVYLPPIFTAVLTSARLYHIKFPLKDPRHKEILAPLYVLSAIQICFSNLPLLDTSSRLLYGKAIKRVRLWAPLQAAQNSDVFHLDGNNPRPQLLSAYSVFLLPSLAQLVGLVATQLTICQVRGGTSGDAAAVQAAAQAQRNSSRITKKILMTNTGSMVRTVTYLLYMGFMFRVMSRGVEVYLIDMNWAAWINIFTSTLTPCLISAVNPLIFISMTPNYLQTLRRGRI